MKGSRTAGNIFAVLALLTLGLAGCSDSNNSSSAPPVASGAPEIIDVDIIPADTVTAGETESVTIALQVTDPDLPNVNSSALDVTWAQASGPAVPLENADTFTVTFTVPQPDDLASDDTVVLQVVISDGENAITEFYSVVINKPDEGPGPGEVLVDAGADQSVNSEEMVTLNATIDPPGSAVNYAWTQTAGTAVTLSSTDTAQTSFTAPAPLASAPDQVQMLTFQIEISDANGVLDTDTVTVAVLPLPLEARPATVYVAQNGGAVTGEIRKLVETQRGSQDLMEQRFFQSGDNEGIVIDILGNIIQIGDDADGEIMDADGNEVGDNLRGGISHLCRVGARPNGTVFNTDVDRNVHAQNYAFPGFPDDIPNRSGLGSPGAKGATLLHEAGMLLVADNRGQQLRLFGTGITGDIGPVNVVTLGVKPWDVAYDTARDIAYVAGVNGTVRILDGYLAAVQAGSQPAETRTLRLLDAGGAVQGVNLHGIAYEPVGDRLVITDVGATDVNGSQSFDSDGAIYVLGNVSQLNGDVTPDAIITNSALGNPVDVAIWGRDAVIAEKANGQVLLYTDIFTSQGGNVAPAKSFPVEVPESVAIEFELDIPANGTDILPVMAGGSVDVDSLVLLTSENKLYRLNPALGDQVDPPLMDLSDSAIGTGSDLVADVLGDVYAVSFNEGGGSNGSDPSRVLVLGRAATSRMLGDAENPAAYSAARDRTLNYPQPFDQTSMPEVQQAVAVDVAPSRGLIFLADATASTIVVTSSCSEGEPLATISLDDDDLPITPPPVPADLDFDEATGDLYVTLQGESRIAVFRDIDVTFDQEPSPIFVTLQLLNNGIPGDAASSVHAVDYVPGADTLIISDLGDGSTEFDGQLLLVQAASSMGSTELVDVVISGDASQLIDPIDIAFDGLDLLVLDDADQRISRYPDILSATTGSLAPTGAPTPLAELGTGVGIALVPGQTSAAPRDLLAAP